MFKIRNIYISDLLFFLIVFCLIFQNIPKQISMPLLLGGNFYGQLSVYPLLIGFICTVYYYIKSKLIPPYFKQFSVFICIYISVLLLSLIIGFIIYPYYDVVLSAPPEQFNGIQIVIDILNKFGFIVEYKIILFAYFVIRKILALFINNLYFFCGSYMIFCWYKDDYKKGLNICLRAISFSLLIIFFYSSIELFYLNGSEFAKHIIFKIRPVFQDGFYPQFIFKQLTSIFYEPSYFGRYFAFSFPLLWILIAQKNNNLKQKFFYIAITIIFTFLLFLTKSRTSFIVFLFEICLLLLATAIIRKKIYFKISSLILIFSIVAFLLSIIFINISTKIKVANIIDTPKTKNIVINDIYDNTKEYFDSNAKSLLYYNARSNSSRYSLMLALIKVGIKYPFLGVGYGINTGYLTDYYISNNIAVNNEVRNWILISQKEYFFKKAYPCLCEYLFRFSETGILGVFLFLFPFIFLIFNILVLIKNNKYNFEYIVILIVISGVMILGIGDYMDLIQCFVVLGLGYAMCYDKNNNNKLRFK